MSKVQVCSTQVVTVMRTSVKEAASGKLDNGQTWHKPPHQVIVVRAMLTELVETFPASFEKPIAVMVADLSAKFEVGQTYLVSIYAEARGKAGEKTNYHLVSHAPVPPSKKA